MSQEDTTVVAQLLRWERERGDRPALGGSGKTYTWAQYAQTARRVARGLISLGHQPGECVAILGQNRPEWVICQMGIVMAGGVLAPIYVTNTPKQAGYIVTHSRAQIAIAGDAALLEAYRQATDSGDMQASHLVCMDALPDEDVTNLEALMQAGDAPEHGAALEERLAALRPDGVHLLIYTSGTTGVPKGVQVTHTMQNAVSSALIARFPVITEVEYRVVSYLPLCHVAEQVFTNTLALALGGRVDFCSDIKQIRAHLVETRPTVFLAVPRVWEKFETALRTNLRTGGALKQRIAAWALATELACFDEQLRRGVPYQPLRRRLAARLVTDTVKQKLGLDALVVAASGAAPIGISTMRFFASLGISIYEAYGMSETYAVVSVTPPEQPRFGTVGPVLDGMALKIAEDGEILARGPNMTPAYLHMPEETAALYDEDGWLRTGDLGSIDEDGFLRITGRKKDILITAGGKNVAPAEIEGLLKGIPGVDQAVVVGDRQPYLAALIVLDPEQADAIGEAAGTKSRSMAELSEDPKLRAWLEAQIAQSCNAGLAGYQTVKRFTVLAAPLTVESGELTPTLKVKRNVVYDKRAADIEAMYDASR
jgi:long-chain acyl-CoA synthetase